MKEEEKSKKCKCGCGKQVNKGCLYAKGCYILGSGMIGKKHHETWRENQSKGIKNAFKQGKMQHALNQTPEFIEKRIKPLRGRKRDKLANKATGEGVRKAWAEGRYHTESFSNARKNMCRVGASSSQMDTIRAMRDMDKLKANNAIMLKNQMQKWKETGDLVKIRTKAKNAKGMLNHLAAKVWMIRDPYGNPYKFSNLAEWARQNEFRFVDDRPSSLAPLWKRIAGGITDLLKANGKSCSYRGWTAVSKMELDDNARDLLNRDCFN